MLASGVGLERFQAEIELAASLVHPNIVPVFDSGVGDDLYFVMPLIEGESLRDRLKRDGAIPIPDALRIARDMANALSYAHGRNVVHRDIKPENVLLMQSGGHALVADFGIAKVLSGAAGASGARGKLTMTGSVVGTPLYMSPEQSLGLTVDARADIYSMAAVVFEMLTGVPPMPGTDAREALTDTPTGEVPTPAKRVVQLPRDIRAVLGKSLSGDASERHATADEFIHALERAHEGGGILTRAGGGAKVARTAIAAAVLVAVAAGGWYANAGGGSDDSAAGLGLLIFPFRATTAAAGEWREAIPDLMATQLDGTPGVRVADPWSLWRPLRRQRDEVARTPEHDEAREIARKAKACCFLLGTVSQVPGRLDISVRVYRPSSQEPVHTFTVGSTPDSVAWLVQRVSMELIQRLARGAGVSTTRGDRAVPRTAAALKNWLIAREYLRRGHIDSADVAIMRSLAEDSSFALSLTDAAGIKSWLQFSRGQQYANLLPLAERALAVADSPGTRSRLRAQAMLASIRTDGPGVERATAAILAMDDSDFEAWNLRSYSHLAYGWQYGVTSLQAMDAAERLYRLDTTNVLSLARRVYLSAALNDPADVRRQLEHLRRADTSVAVVRALLHGIELLSASDADYAARVSHYRNVSATEYIGIVRLLRIFRPDRLEHFARVTLAEVTSPNRPIAIGALVQLFAGGSRWRMLDSMRSANAFAIRVGFETVVDRMTVAAAIAGAASAEHVAPAVGRLAVGLPPDSALALFRKRNVWQDGWLVGAFHAMYGDTALADRWRAAMGTLPAGGSPKEWARAIQADIESRLAARRGDRASALAHARRAYAFWDIRADQALELLPEPAIRFQFASLLRDAGQADSARALFSSLVPPANWLGFYTARGALELAELQERAGQRRDAERNFMIASLLWERADADAAPLRARARSGLARLTD